MNNMWDCPWCKKEIDVKPYEDYKCPECKKPLYWFIEEDADGNTWEELDCGYEN